MEYENKNLIVVMGQFVNENGQMQTLEEFIVRFPRKNCEIEICDGIPEQSPENKLITNYETLDEIVAQYPEEKHKIKIYDGGPEHYTLQDCSEEDAFINNDLGKGKVQRPSPWPEPPDDDNIV